MKLSENRFSFNRLIISNDLEPHSYIVYYIIFFTIAINYLIYLLLGDNLFLAYRPNDLVNGRWFHFVTYIFAHNNSKHLYSNMMLLLIFGEMSISLSDQTSFLFMYFGGSFISGVICAYCNLIAKTQLDYYNLGASSGISALIGSILILTLFKEKTVTGKFFHSLLIVSFFYLMQNFRILSHLGHFVGFMTGIAVQLIMLIATSKYQP